MEINFLAMAVASLTTIVIGFIWYHPKVFGTVWRRETGLSEEEINGGNRVKIIIFTVILSLMMTIVMMSLTIHQSGALGMIGGQVTDDTLPSFQLFMNDYGTAFRSFKHGALHGFIAGLLFAFPMNAINGLYERKSAKYIFINSGYWILTLTIMGALICGWI